MEETVRVIRAKRLFDGSGRPPKEDAAVLVAGNVIREIGHRDEIVSPPDAQVINLGDRSLMPGLIDAHVHFYGVSSTQLYTVEFEDEPYRALRAAGEARRMLEAGITAARCCGSSVGPALRRAVDEGHVPGPRIVAAGEFVCSTSGTWDPNTHMSVPIDWAKDNGFFADGADGLRELVRRRMRDGSSLIKVGLSKGNWDDTFPVWGDDPYEQVLAMTVDEISAVTHEAHVNKLKVAAHCIGDDAVRAAIEYGADTIEHGFGISDETRKLLVDRNMVVVTTLSIMDIMTRNGDAWNLSPHQKQVVQRHVDAQRADFEKGLEAGVRYALGTDLVGGPTHPLDMAAREFELAVDYGMNPADAVVAGTAMGADAMGFGDRIGTVERGKLADLVAFSGDPLEDITALQRVEFVMQDGEVVVDTTTPTGS